MKFFSNIIYITIKTTYKLNFDLKENEQPNYRLC